jgi:YfiH family protein
MPRLMMDDMTKSMLPTVRAPFEWRTYPPGPVLVCTALEPTAPHFFSTSGWRLGAKTLAVDEAAVWREIAVEIGVEPERLSRLRQVHGRAVHIAAPGSHLEPADIIVGNDTSVAMAVQSADCAPILIGDERTGAVAAAHAGWRGLAARTPQAAVEALTRQFGSEPEHLIVAIGPMIGGCCYEVGADVREAFEKARFGGGALERWFSERPLPAPDHTGLRTSSRPGHWFFDGLAATREQLRDAGVRPDRVFAAELCTAGHPATLCSYRRDGSPAGRLAAVIRPSL